MTTPLVSKAQTLGLEAIGADLNKHKARGSAAELLARARLGLASANEMSSLRQCIGWDQRSPDRDAEMAAEVRQLVG